MTNPFSKLLMITTQNLKRQNLHLMLKLITFLYFYLIRLVLETDIRVYTHSDAPLLQLLEDSFDGNREGERKLAASLLRVRRCDDVDVRFVRLSRVLSVVVLNQILQVTRQ